MKHDIHQEITRALLNDYEFKVRGNWLQSGRCPSCDKKELFTSAESPWVIRCGRQNNCGWEGRVKELYPDIFEGFNKRYQPTEKNPNATADAFMKYSRGFDIGLIKGWYEQGKFWKTNADKGTATVRFWLDKSAGVYMDRLIEQVIITDPETGEKENRKAHFNGANKGLWWQPPELQIEDGDEVWLAEGCLDVIGLMLNGIKAVSTLSSGGYPDTMLKKHKGKQITWVWALDSDKAGRECTIKHIRRMREEGYECAAAQPPGGKKKQDWNDLHQAGRLTKKDLDYYRYLGALLIAKSAEEKALLMYGQKGRREFPFEFNNFTYWFRLNLDKFNKAVEKPEGKDKDNRTDEEIRDQALISSSVIAPIANCRIQFLYFQAEEITGDSWYYCRVSFPHDGAPVKSTFTSAQLSSAAEFDKRLLAVAAGAVWDGSTIQLKRIKKDRLFNIKIVQTMDFIGYSKEHGCYVFSDVAVKDGRIIRLNDEDFFDMDKLSIKSLNHSVSLNINPSRDHYQTEWVEQIYKSFGAKGLVALAFWFGSLFAEQIRATQKSYPFIEIIGEPASGKSTLVEFLWKLVGRHDYEGFDPSKSTLAARARNFAQVSNLPVSLIEADRDEDAAHGKRFDWDELKTAYNGRSVRARGMKSSGNETYEPPFRGAVVISQNDSVNASEAILQRIVHLNFTKDGHTPETKRLAQILERTPMDHVSTFILEAVTREKEVMELVNKRAPEYESALLGDKEIKSVRIAKNHAQIWALLDALAKVVPLTDDMINETSDLLLEMAKERQRAINMDHPMVVQFWEAFDYLNDTRVMDHSKKEEFIAVNLNHFVQVATEKKQQIPLIADLKRHLKTSRHRKYQGQRGINSAIWSPEMAEAKTVRCWVFEREK